MDNYEKTKLLEISYLKNILSFIKKQLEKDTLSLDDRKDSLIASRRDMWENAPKSTNDFDKIPDMNNYLAEINYQTQNYEQISKRISKYNSMLTTPYFGRFDFKEDGYDETEKIYIGIHSLMDDDAMSMLVYDWRSPIAGMYYQFDLGRGSYESPVGTLSGDITLKRQYKIKDGKLKYFFDSSVEIKDEILQEVLSRNSSSQMRNIVETIQKEQDLIIRDTSNQLLIVQGVAGSGKTSIALHRIAFLLYAGMDSKLYSNNIMIISPNNIFSKYIANVLPELGEENVQEITLDTIIRDILKLPINIETRSQMLESLVHTHSFKDTKLQKDSLSFKNSLEFKTILDRFINYYVRKLIPFSDIYYDGQIVRNKEELLNQLLNDQTNMPVSKVLNRISNIILSNIEERKINRLSKIQAIVEANSKHSFNIEHRSNQIARLEINPIKRQIDEFLNIDFLGIYKLLFSNKDLFFRLSYGISLPDNICDIIRFTKNELNNKFITYSDSAPVAYLKLKFTGDYSYPNIRHLVVDEAQDYYPLQYELIKLVFPNSSFTILGDYNQSLEKEANDSIYDDIKAILNKDSMVTMTLNTGYRSSYEINKFSQKVLSNPNINHSFVRHGNKPEVIQTNSLNELNKEIANDIDYFISKGYQKIAVICKTQRECQRLYSKLINLSKPVADKTIDIIPAYLAKGLEFDVVLVYNVSKSNYYSALDQKLLYIASTRALHELKLYYTNEKSKFLSFNI